MLQILILACTQKIRLEVQHIGIVYDINFLISVRKNFFYGFYNNMHILPVKITETHINKTYQSKQTSNIRYNKCLSADTVSFGHTAKNAAELRGMFKYGMIDIYTGLPTVDPELFEKFLQDRVFSKNLQSVVKLISPLKDCLHPVNSDFFALVENYAKIYPFQRLNEFVAKITPRYQKMLLDIQRPIFNELIEESESLTKQQKEAFVLLMDKTQKQLNNKTISYNFSKNEFKHKLKRIKDGIKERGIDDEISIMTKIIGMAEGLPYIPSGRNFHHKRNKVSSHLVEKQAIIIRQIDNYYMRSLLRDDKELNELINSAKMQIYGIPVVIPFQRKSFIHELETITDTLSDSKYAHKLIAIARKLPTAHEELSAFVLKSSRMSPEKIGHDLLVGQTASIDHRNPVHPQKGVKNKQKGIDDLSNYYITSNFYNAERGNRPMHKQIEKYPKIYTGAQLCADKIINLLNGGIVKDYDRKLHQYLVDFADNLFVDSPPDNRIIIDLSRLK